MKRGGWVRWALVLFLGSIIGTLLGQIVGSLLKPGFLRDALLKGATVGLKEPLNLDLSVLQVAFGLTLSVNPLTLVGFLVALFSLMKFSR